MSRDDDDDDFEDDDDDIELDEDPLEGDTPEELLVDAAANELFEGQKLAAFLDGEFKRLGIETPRWMHAFATLVAGWLIDGDDAQTMLEYASNTTMTDDDKLKHLIDEIKELATIGRQAKKEQQQQQHRRTDARSSKTSSRH